MAISRNSTATGTNNSSSFNVTIAGSIVISFVTYLNGSTLTAATLNGVSGTVLQTTNIASEGYKVSAVSFIGTFTGSQAVTFTWSGGTPTDSRSAFLGYNGSRFVDVSNQLSDTTGTVSATVVTSGCWVLGYAGCAIGAGASYPTSGTNNDGYYAATGTSNGLLRNAIGDSNGTVATGSQSVVTGTTGGYTFGKIIVVIGVSTDYPLTATQASFTLTGIAATLAYGVQYLISAAQASFTLTGQVATLTARIHTAFINQVKNTISATDQTKSTAISPTNSTKSIINPVNIPKD